MMNFINVFFFKIPLRFSVILLSYLRDSWIRPARENQILKRLHLLLNREIEANHPFLRMGCNGSIKMCSKTGRVFGNIEQGGNPPGDAHAATHSQIDVLFANGQVRAEPTLDSREY